jgi:heme/copper-type cytochrome/quinol oxidase subunit 3
MTALIGSEAIFFATLIATYLVYKGMSLGGPTSASAVHVFHTAIATFILLSSSVTMVLATAAHRRGEQNWTRFWLLMTILCGLVFLGNETHEFTVAYQEGIRIQTNLFTQTYYTLVGFHGLHVTIGLLWLLVVLVASLFDLVPTSRPITMECLSIYWHFVDLVWVVVFMVVYLFKDIVPGR